MFDDSRVQRTGSNGKANGAYMLFYRKRRVENQLGYKSLSVISHRESVVVGGLGDGSKNLALVGKPVDRVENVALVGEPVDRVGILKTDLLDLRKGGGGGGGLFGDGGDREGGSNGSNKYSTLFMDGDEPPSVSPRGRK